LVYDGRVYVYTGRDEDTLVNDFFTMNEWRVYSSADIVNWTDHGSPLRYSDFSWSKGDAWAGQVIHRNDKFYYYIPTTSASLNRMTIGVAVSDSPIGPFADALGHPLITENCGDIDPTVFIDNDGQAYLYWGNPNLCYVELNEDMISYEGSVEHVPMTTQSFGTRTGDDQRATTYEEGPWFYKRADRYYLVFAAGPISEHIGYATSPGPTGPWTYGGVVMPSQGASFTNHPGVIDFMGESYFFYHNGAWPGGGGYHRSVCVEKFAYNADGSWPTLNMSEQGPPAISNLDPYVQTEAETIAWESGIETEPCSEGGMDVTSIQNGDFIKVESVDFGAGAVSFDARVASDTSGGSIELRLDSEDGTLIATCIVAATGGAQGWTTKSCPVSGATRMHDLYLKFTGGNGALFNFNWWRFTSSEPADAGSPDAGGTIGSGDATSGAGGRIAGAGGTAASATGAGGGRSGSGATGATGGSMATPGMGNASGGSTAGSGGSGSSLEGSASADGRAAGCGCRIGAPRSNRAQAIVMLLATVLLRRRQRLSARAPEHAKCITRHHERRLV
jgi:hypothetical protein